MWRRMVAYGPILDELPKARQPDLSLTEGHANRALIYAYHRKPDEAHQGFKLVHEP